MVQILQQQLIGRGVNKGGGEDVETREPETRGLSVNTIADSLSLNVLVYFAKISSHFPMKINKRKIRKCFRCLKEFSRRFTRGQLKNEGGRELHEIKRSPDKTEIGKEII